jgi:hypothetical protein
VHPEDAVALGLLVVVAGGAVVVPTACTPKGPSPSAVLEGGRARRDRDASRSRGDDDEEEEEAREDLEALDAGISLRALSCATDRECLTHRCDVEHARCRFPCHDDGDCQTGARCAVSAGELAACFVPR